MTNPSFQPTSDSIAIASSLPSTFPPSFPSCFPSSFPSSFASPLESMDLTMSDYLDTSPLTLFSPVTSLTNLRPPSPPCLVSPPPSPSSNPLTSFPSSSFPPPTPTPPPSSSLFSFPPVSSPLPPQTPRMVYLAMLVLWLQVLSLQSQSHSFQSTGQQENFTPHSGESTSGNAHPRGRSNGGSPWRLPPFPTYESAFSHFDLLNEGFSDIRSQMDKIESSQENQQDKVQGQEESDLLNHDSWYNLVKDSLMNFTPELQEKESEALKQTGMGNPKTDSQFESSTLGLLASPLTTFAIPSPTFSLPSLSLPQKLFFGPWKSTLSHLSELSPHILIHQATSLFQSLVSPSIHDSSLSIPIHSPPTSSISPPSIQSSRSYLTMEKEAVLRLELESLESVFLPTLTPMNSGQGSSFQSGSDSILNPNWNIKKSNLDFPSTIDSNLELDFSERLQSQGMTPPFSFPTMEDPSYLNSDLCSGNPLF